MFSFGSRSSSFCFFNIKKFMSYHAIPSSSFIVNGFSCSGITAGLKPSGKPDLAMWKSEKSCVAAGCFTKNSFAAAPVILDKEILSKHANTINSLVINAGQANACTGEEGLKNARKMVDYIKQLIPGETLIMSTGVIGRQLDLPKIETGIKKAYENLSNTKEAWNHASRAIMTTDTTPHSQDEDNTAQENLQKSPRSHESQYDDDDVQQNKNDLGKTPMKTNPFAIESYYDDDNNTFYDDDDQAVSRYRTTLSSSPVDDSNGEITSIPSGPRQVIRMISNHKQESRRRRAERALTVTDWRGRLMLELSSWCDIYETKGIALVVFFILLFVIIYHAIDGTKHEGAQRMVVIIGASTILTRLSWAPLYWLVWGRIAERRRKDALKMYDKLNGEHACGGMPIADDDDGIDIVEIQQQDHIDVNDDPTAFSIV